MCGITAYLGQTQGFQNVYKGIYRLKNRGYDSCGIASLSDNSSITVSKEIGESGLDRLGDSELCHKGAKALIAHTRWATHGCISLENCHPHLDMSGRFAIVHNGVINNFAEIKTFLLGKGYVFNSETDTEVIIQLISYFINLDKFGESEMVELFDDVDYVVNAITRATEKLQGTWGLVILDLESPEKLYVTKNGSPLLIGYDNHFAMVASEPAGLQHIAKQYFNVEDKSIITVSLNQDGVKFTKDSVEMCKNRLNCMATSVNPDYMGNFIDSPDPYPHWMLKEIMEQPETINRAINYGGRLLGDKAVRLGGLESHINELRKIRHLIISGCGTSYHAGLVSSYIFKHIGNFITVQVIDASEFSYDDLPKVHDMSTVGVVFLSQSGETKDVHRIMEEIEDTGVIMFSVVNVVESLIARKALCGVYLNAGREVAVASTKSFTSQVIILTLIAIWFAHDLERSNYAKTRMVTNLRNMSGHVTSLCNMFHFNSGWLDNDLIPQRVIDILAQSDRIFILGRGICYAIALEGALKIKEVSYIHAQGYPGGGLKHGPFALIEAADTDSVSETHKSYGTPVILLSIRDSLAEKIDLAAVETATRGAWTLGMTTRERAMVTCDSYNELIYVPGGMGLLDSVYLGIVLQYLAYRLAMIREISPDFPRNLAKVVTVDG